MNKSQKEVSAEGRFSRKLAQYVMRREAARAELLDAIKERFKVLPVGDAGNKLADARRGAVNAPPSI